MREQEMTEQAAGSGANILLQEYTESDTTNSINAPLQSQRRPQLSVRHATLI